MAFRIAETTRETESGQRTSQATDANARSGTSTRRPGNCPADYNEYAQILKRDTRTLVARGLFHVMNIASHVTLA